MPTPAFYGQGYPSADLKAVVRANSRVFPFNLPTLLKQQLMESMRTTPTQVDQDEPTRDDGKGKGKDNQKKNKNKGKNNEQKIANKAATETKASSTEEAEQQSTP